MMTFQGIYQPIAAIVGSGEGQQLLPSSSNFYQKNVLEETRICAENLSVIAYIFMTCTALLLLLTPVKTLNL